MKRSYFIFLLLLFSISSFSQNRMNRSEIEKDQEIFYLKKDKTPFTGIILENWDTGYSETEVTRDLKNGAFIQYYANGNLRSYYRYKNNKLNGISFDLQENSDTLLVVDQFLDDVVVGSVRSYYPNGNINEILTVRDLDKNYFIGELGGRFGSHKLFQRLKITGSVECYYDNGQLEYQIHYSKGLLDGKTVGYYPNGNMKFKATYIKGISTDTLSIYNEEGKLQEESVYDSEGKLLNKKTF